MFCPNCGTNQAEGKKFCTNCGTNLVIISQALSGQIPAASAPFPPAPDPREAERQRQLATGVKLTIIGGVIVALKFFTLLFTLSFRGGDADFGFWGFVGLVLAAVGISKIINARPVYYPAPRPQQMPAPQQQPNLAPPRPVFSTPAEAPRTNSLDPVPRTPSVLEEETQHLPKYAPPREAPK
jgi:hypothetical protein